MPRGNDAEEAKQELQQHYGDYLNAGDMLAAHHEAHSQELAAAQLRPRDDSVEIDLKSIKLDGKDAKDDKVIAAAKHGDQVVYVAERPDGRVYKDVVPFEDVKATPASDESS